MMQASSHQKSQIFERLDALRVRTGKTWDAVATDLGVDRSLFFHIKAGKRNLGPKALYRLEQAEGAAGITAQIDDLANESDAKEKPATQIEQKLPGHFKTFPERLTWLRTERLKMSLRAFAESVNVSKTYLSNLETGKREKPSDRLLESIATKHRVRMDWLRNGFGTPTTLVASFGGGDLPLSGPGAPLYAIMEGGDPHAIMRIMISQMDNAELVEKSYLVLTDDGVTPEEKISVVTLYVRALCERISPASLSPEVTETERELDRTADRLVRGVDADAAAHFARMHREAQSSDQPEKTYPEHIKPKGAPEQGSNAQTVERELHDFVAKPDEFSISTSEL